MPRKCRIRPAWRVHGHLTDFERETRERWSAAGDSAAVAGAGVSFISDATIFCMSSKRYSRYELKSWRK